MKFVFFLILGIICVVVTRVIILSEGIEKISELKPGKQLLVIILAMLSVSLVGGIIVGDLASFALFEDVEEYLAVDYFGWGMLTIIGAIITYVFGHLILGLYHFDKIAFQIYFVILFIISILLCTSEMVKYDNNILTNTETVIVSETERELIQFEGIYVQKVLEEKDTDSKNVDVENTKKDLTGDDKVSYWYINKKGEGQYNSVSVKSCKIKLIGDDESPYVKTVKKCKQITTINNNNGKESTEKEEEWKEYYFYVPESIFK